MRHNEKIAIRTSRAGHAGGAAPVTALAAQEVGLVEADAVLENGTVVLTLTAAEETTSGRLTVEYDNALLTYAGLKEAGTVTSEDAGGSMR